LFTDVLRLGSADAKALVVITSGTHGAEGPCGSGCQVAALHDQDLLARFKSSNVALLLIHAVNPYGFAHCRRVNEDNVDMNRNFLDFSQAMPPSQGYGDIANWLVPEIWPPEPANEAAIENYIQTHGLPTFQRAMGSGQTTHPQGLFYAGTQATWSNRTMRSILREHGARAASIAWVDVHTGLGPSGHGEKIFAGRDDANELTRARACWGADVFSPFAGKSFSEPVRGSLTTLLYKECPQAKPISLGLEFGTKSLPETLLALRAEQWLHYRPQTDAATRSRLKQDMQDAFYIDTEAWRGAVSAQTRVALLQAQAFFSA
jgi:predicted deacylase